jgi:ectoine hydroxylase-related dioxygenase (phytanoyl-CoA dioxygenase family)
MLEAWQTVAGGESPESMDTPHFANPALFRWLLADPVLDLVEPLIGPDIALFSSHFICKPPGVGKRVPWHEDSAYWQKILDPMEVVTIWLAIDPSTPANGCMRVIPGTHSDGYSDYVEVDDPDRQVFGTEIQPGQFDEADAVDCVLDRNECSIHHAKLIHGSNANTSNMRRCGYTMRYVPASSRWTPDPGRADSGFRLYLARGRDRAGNDYGDPTQVNETWLEKVEQTNPAKAGRLRALAPVG